jgi:hypothetical protein
MFATSQIVHPTASTSPELEHLYCAFNRLVEVGETNSPVIDDLKRVVLHRIANFEASKD